MHDVHVGLITWMEVSVAPGRRDTEGSPSSLDLCFGSLKDFGLPFFRPFALKLNEDQE